MKRAWVKLLAMLLVAAVSLTLGTWENDQPMRYHPDEPGKVRQVLSGTWNFNHPQALLTLTRGVMAMAGPPVDAGQAVAEAVAQRGRLASAVFVATTAVALAATAWLLHGPAAGLLAGLLLATSPALVLRAHYMKEDTALVAGLAITALGLGLLQRRRLLVGTIALGLGCGTAAAGKYVGIAPACLAVLLPLIMPAVGPWWKRLVVAVAAAALGLAAWGGWNFELFSHGAVFAEGFGREWRHGLEHGHVGLYPPALGLFFVDAIQHETPWLVLVGAAAGVAWIVVQRRRSGVAHWALALFPLLYYVMLMGSTVGFSRYVLPVTAGLTYLAAVGVAGWMGQVQRTRWRALLLLLPASLLVGSSLVTTTRYLASFSNDSRDRLLAWITTELPPGARIIEQDYARLPRATLRTAGHSLHSMTDPLTRFGIEDLRSRGFTHLVLTSHRYFRYLDGHLRPMPGTEQEYQRTIERYSELRREGHVVWRSAQGRPMPGYTDPQILVYDIRPRGGR